jgi:hypothetical protein
MRPSALVVLLALACSRTPAGPTAGDICHKLEAAGVAAKCQVASRGDAGLLAQAASDRVTFDLPSVPGKTGQVLGFRDAASYEQTVKGYEAAAILAGPHRYGSSKALIFVQMNSAASNDVGAKASAVVAGL